MRYILSVLAALVMCIPAGASTVYFENSELDWPAPNVFVWKSGMTPSVMSWPGVTMTDIGNGIWSYEFDRSDYDGIIFNNGSLQTGDLTFHDGHIYTYNGPREVTGCDLGRFEDYVPTRSGNPLGAVLGFDDDSSSVTFRCERGSLVITPYGPETVKVFTLKNDASATQERRSISVCAEPQGGYEVGSDDTGVTINLNGNLVVSVDRATSLITYADKSGRVLLAEKKGLENLASGGSRASFAAMGDKGFYGGGYNGMRTDWDGNTMIMNNTQTGGWTCHTNPPHNICIPFFVSTSGYGLYFDDHHRYATIQPSSLGSSYSSGSLTPVAYYFIGGSSMNKVMENYSELTGRQPLPPFWGLGYITSRYGYHSETESDQAIAGIKEMGLPLDGIVFDLYWQGADESGMGNLEWHTPKFPDANGMISRYKREGIHTLVITEPFFTSNSSNYTALKQRGFLADDDVEYMEWLRSPKVGLIDASNPEAMEWMAGYYEKHTRNGMAGWWLDLGEPERHDYDSHHYGGTVDQVHNEFGNLWIEAAYNRLHNSFPEMRQLLMPRSGTSGMQRFATFPWTGDILRSWEGLQAQVPALVSASMSGVGYLGSDIGGFTSNGINADLYLRWIELGVFYPMMRTHSPDRPEPYYYPGIKDDIVKFINMRYSYLPYTYTLAFHNSVSGTPIARPVNFDAADPALLADCKDEYLWGHDVLVAPVLDNATSRTVRFPEGKWVDINRSDRVYEGGTSTEYPAPLGCLPVFARSGSIIPKFGQTSFANTSSIDHSLIECDVYYDADVDAAGEFYEDDLTSFSSAESGSFLLTRFRGSHRGSNYDIIVEPSGNGFDGMPETRSFVFALHNFQLPADAKVMTGNDEELPAFSSLAALRGSNSGGYVREGNKTFVKLDIPSRENASLTLGYSSLSGIDDVAGCDAMLTLSYSDGLITYSAPVDVTGLSLEIFAVTGLRAFSVSGLDAAGFCRQIEVDLPKGMYVARLSGRDRNGNLVSLSEKVLCR